LNSEIRESRIVVANCVKPLADLEKWGLHLVGLCCKFPSSTTAYCRIFRDLFRRSEKSLSWSRSSTRIDGSTR
jgi:hypothetical protein